MIPIVSLRVSDSPNINHWLDLCRFPDAVNRHESSSGSILHFEKLESSKTAIISFPTERVSPFVPLFKRIESLSQLQEGWLDGEGKPFNSNDLDWLMLSFIDHYPEELPLPYIYPTLEGCIRAEWTINSTDISLEIDPSYRNGEWHSLNFDNGKENSETIDLSVAQGWMRLTKNLNEILGVTA